MGPPMTRPLSRPNPSVRRCIYVSHRVVSPAFLVCYAPATGRALSRALYFGNVSASGQPAARSLGLIGTARANNNSSAQEISYLLATGKSGLPGAGQVARGSGSRGVVCGCCRPAEPQPLRAGHPRSWPPAPACHGRRALPGSGRPWSGGQPRLRPAVIGRATPAPACHGRAGTSRLRPGVVRRATPPPAGRGPAGAPGSGSGPILGPQRPP
jgi:hypothetical protein